MDEKIAVLTDTNSGITPEQAAMAAGFTVCIGWKMLGQPLGLGAAVPGTIACAVALVTVSLLTCQKSPSVYLYPDEMRRH